MNRPTILIFGISSFVGSNLAEFLKKDYRIIGTYYRNRVEMPDVFTIPCDVLNRDYVQRISYTFRPQITIYAIGVSSVEMADKRKKLADAINTAGVFNVTTFSERYKSKFCLFSSAYIFSGDNIVFREVDTPTPNTFYGRTMASSEFYVQKSCLNYLILRCCNLYGRGYTPARMTMFEKIEQKCFKNEAFICDSKIHSGFIDIEYLAKAFKKCLEENVTNRLLQLSTKDVVSHFDFAKTYAKTFGYSDGLILQGQWRFSIDESLTSDYANPDGNSYYHLDVSNLETVMSTKMPTVEESIQRTFERLGGHKGSKQKNKKSSGVSYI